MNEIKQSMKLTGIENIIMMKLVSLCKIPSVYRTRNLWKFCFLLDSPKEIKELLDSISLCSFRKERHVLILEQKNRYFVKDTITEIKKLNFLHFQMQKILAQFQNRTMGKYSFREYKTIFSSHSKQIQEKEIESFYGTFFHGEK